MGIGDWILTATGEWKEVDEAYDTGEWELVYNLRVADHHTYFVGDADWGWCAWAHNTYEIVSQSTGNYAAGSYIRVKEDGGTYDRPWYRPKSLTVARQVADAACVDNQTKLGDRMAAKAQQLADGWTALAEGRRYGARYTGMQGRVNEINAILTADGKSALTLDQIDKEGARFPALSTPVDAYKEKVRQFWFHRSVAIGVYVHDGVAEAFPESTTPGLTYNQPPTPGPDFTYVSQGKTVYFEILPDTTSGRKAHAERTMKNHLWRAVYYNRNAINNPSDSVNTPSEEELD